MRSVLVLVGLVLTVGGCAGAPDRATDAGVRRDELAAHGGQVCPSRLPAGSGHGFGPYEPAADAPGLTRPERAWVCRYAPRGSAGLRWVRDVPARPVPAADLASLGDLLAQVRPRPEPQACTDDLGPRWLLVTADAGDLTGLAVDDFGCRDVRLTDDPFTVPAGESRNPDVVAGVLTGPRDLVSSLAAWAGVP